MQCAYRDYGLRVVKQELLVLLVLPTCVTFATFII